MAEQIKADGGGLRFNSGKRNWHLLPYDALGALVDVFDYGATKYADRNWERGQRYSICYSALLRHLTKWWAGETHDEESGCLHLAHVVWNALALLTFEIRGMSACDDRPKYVEGTSK